MTITRRSLISLGMSNSSSPRGHVALLLSLTSSPVAPEELSVIPRSCRRISTGHYSKEFGPADPDELLEFVEAGSKATSAFPAGCPRCYRPMNNPPQLPDCDISRHGFLYGI